MIDLKKLQKSIYQNKLEKGFNTTNIHKEFCLLLGEVAEAYKAWEKKLPDTGEELADVAIYLLGIAEILHINLEEEVVKKVAKNKKREYKKMNGVLSRIKEADES
jgi:NTP pyrophosphatase (non-canonical NTP hydrolase)